MSDVANLITAIISGAAGGIIAAFFYQKYRVYQDLKTHLEIAKKVTESMRQDYFEMAKQTLNERFPSA